MPVSSPLSESSLDTDKSPAEGEEQPLGNLFYYVLLATGLAFFNRAMPTPFLPLVLSQQFEESSSTVGFIMATYPLGALVITPWASAVARRTGRIARMHSLAIYGMVFVSLAMASVEWLRALVGPQLTTLAIILIRSSQGCAQAFYMAANTSMVTRRFPPSKIPYIVGMIEVAVGSGAQVGRLVGGFLFDAGGFGCPFCFVAICQFLVATLGFAFPDPPGEGLVPGIGAKLAHHTVEKIPWARFATYRVCLAVAGVFTAYLMTGLVDATLPQHLEAYLGPMPVSIVSEVSSVRNLAYLLVSWACAQLLHKGDLSLEMMLIVGSICVVMGMMMIAPLPWVAEAGRDTLQSALSPASCSWIMQILSLVLLSAGNALLFVPGLPLMQAEVRHLGTTAAEQVSLAFMIAMSAGEGAGPMLGGVLAEHFGFRGTTAAFTILLFPLAICSVLAYDPEVIQARSSKEETLETPLMKRQISAAQGNLELVSSLNVPMDCEGAYMLRRLAFVLNDDLVPNSAPSTSFRRTFQNSEVKPFLSVPTRCRRTFDARSAITPTERPKAADFLPKPSRLGSKERLGSKDNFRFESLEPNLREVRFFESTPASRKPSPSPER